MKRSNKLILTIAVLFMVLFFSCLLMLRNDLMLYKAGLDNKYKKMVVGSFESLDISGNWKVRIIQGKECKLELAAGGDSILKPIFEIKMGTLYLKSDTMVRKENAGNIVARITMPSLKALKAVSDSRIHIENFKADSLQVELENAGAFTGANNRFQHISFKTSGKASLEFTDTQEK